MAEGFTKHKDICQFHFLIFFPVIMIGYHEKFENKCSIFQNTWLSQRKISACTMPSNSFMVIWIW